MSILPGFQKYKRHIRIGDDYILDSEWTHAKTVEMSDGNTLDDTVANINREITATKKSVSDGKSTVANAITAQGVTTATDATFATMAANIGKVGTDKYNTGYNAGVAATKVGTATAAQVLSGKTFTNASTVGLTGTMADYSANPQTVTLSSTQTGTSTLSLSAGYHSSVQVNAASVYSAGMTAADARANVNSTNYQEGYAAGVAAGKADTLTIPYEPDVAFTFQWTGSPTYPPNSPLTGVVTAFYNFQTSGSSSSPEYYINGNSGNPIRLTTNRWWTRAEIASQAGISESSLTSLTPYSGDNSDKKPGWVYVKIGHV